MIKLHHPAAGPQPLSCSKLSPVASLVLKGRESSGEQSVPAVCGVESALEGKGQIMKDSGVALPPPHPTPKKRKEKQCFPVCFDRHTLLSCSEFTAFELFYNAVGNR